MGIFFTAQVVSSWLALPTKFPSTELLFPSQIDAGNVAVTPATVTGIFSWLSFLIALVAAVPVVMTAVDVNIDDAYPTHPVPYLAISSV